MSEFQYDFDKIVRKYGFDQYDEVELIKEARVAAEQSSRLANEIVEFMGVEMSELEVMYIARGPIRKPDPRFTYVLCPGYVRSKVDGDEHFIGAPQLAALYGVNINECRILHMGKNLRREGWQDEPNFIYLMPRTDGVYILPKTNL